MAFPQGENGALPIVNGGTGADNVTSALSNLGILGAIVNASVSGRTITFTKKDNTKFSINTQDTNNGIVAALLEQNGYVKFSNGLILQWGVVAKSDASGSYTFVLPVAVSNVLVATSAIKGWNNTDNNLCWHCVGTTSGPKDIVVTWNCYDARTRISYVGYIALCI